MASAKNVDGFIPVYSNTMYVRDLLPIWVFALFMQDPSLSGTVK